MQYIHSQYSVNFVINSHKLNTGNKIMQDAPQMCPKDKRQFMRVTATLYKVLENAKITYPDAMFHIEGEELQLLSDPYLQRGKGKNQRNILARNYISGDIEG